jgi:hypothetical protein
MSVYYGCEPGNVNHQSTLDVTAQGMDVPLVILLTTRRSHIDSLLKWLIWSFVKMACFH